MYDLRKLSQDMSEMQYVCLKYILFCLCVLLSRLKVLIKFMRYPAQLNIRIPEGLTQFVPQNEYNSIIPIGHQSSSDPIYFNILELQ